MWEGKLEGTTMAKPLGQLPHDRKFVREACERADLRNVNGDIDQLLGRCAEKSDEQGSTEAQSMQHLYDGLEDLCQKAKSSAVQAAVDRITENVSEYARKHSTPNVGRSREHIALQIYARYLLEAMLTAGMLVRS